jgi:hypothetical protein
VGKSWGKFAVAPLAAATLLLALPVAAPAATAEDETKSNGYGAFILQGTNGYRISVIAIFQPGYGKSSDIYLGVTGKGRRAVYLVPGVVTDTKIEADLGSLGEIDVTFRPSGKEGVAHPKCAPKRRAVYKKGTYVGTIEFRGEEGYTQVSANRARFVHVLASVGCPYTVTDEVFEANLPGASLWARAKQRGLELQANQNRPGKPVRVEASIRERRGPIWIRREVTSTYSADSFHFAPDLRTAVLNPPAPFFGAGFFHRDAKPAGRWTGDLRVDFPGRSSVFLTGDRFRVSLRHARLSKETRSPSRPNLSAWPSTKPSPTAFATSLLPAPR